MNIGKAMAIFHNINSDKYSETEKAMAIYRVMHMETHNSVTKNSMLKVIRWLWDRQFNFMDYCEWIPVSESLPKNISTVIVQVKEIIKPTFGWYGSINGWRLSDKDYKGLTGFSVIAWMPLPEPYKEQNDDI